MTDQNPSYQIRLPAEIRAAIMDRGTGWARGILAAALAHPDPEGVLAYDATADQLRAAADLAGRLRSLDVANAADYAATLAERTSADAVMALQHLIACGWRHGEILAVMQSTMGGIMIYGTPLGLAIALECSDARRLGTVDLAGWGVEDDRWSWAVTRLRDDPESARAILDISRAFWASPGPSGLERALYRGAGLAARLDLPRPHRLTHPHPRPHVSDGDTRGERS